MCVKIIWVLVMDNEELLKNYYKETDEKMRLRYLDLMLLDLDILALILKNIKENVELKNNAYALNILSKKKKVQDYLSEHLTLTTLLILLNSDDPKIRKNTYIMLGNVTFNGYEKLLLEALEKETTNYCISSIILSLGNYKIDELEKILNDKLKQLGDLLKENKIEEKHYLEIKKSIEKVLLKNSDFIKHEFKGFIDKRGVILTIMPALKNASMNEIKAKFNDARFVEDGILIKTNDYNSIFSLRTFYEAFLYSKEGINLDKDKVKTFISNILKKGLISSCHYENNNPFYYRIEIKSIMNKKQKICLIDSIKEEIDNKLKGEYINNPSNYEFEIRVSEKENKYNVYFKLYTVKDTRYSYRVTDLPASINPTTASIIMQEIKGYLKEDSDVLDAFCGTFTMLIERSFIKKYKSLTGLDISEEAINYSKINANNVPLKINLIWEDILKYKGLEFDEIISNMPFGNRVSNHELNEILYKRFISILDTLLKENGYAFLLTSEISLMKNLIKQNQKLKLVKNIYVESGGLKPHLFIIKKIS